MPTSITASCDFIECLEDCYNDCRSDTHGCGLIEDWTRRQECETHCRMGCGFGCQRCSNDDSDTGGGGGNLPGNGEDQGGERHDGIFDPYHP